MPETPSAPQKNQTDEHKEKYYSFQIKGWTNFDPTDKALSKIAEGVDRGDGVLNLVEVLKVENDLAGIGDVDVRECFANILAAKRLVRTIAELPKSLREEIRMALKAEEESAPRKTAVSVVNLPGNGDATPRTKQWP